MEPYRYSLGLLELASGACLLVLAICMMSVQTFDIYPPLGFLPGFIAEPLFFRLATYAQGRMPEASKLATFSLSRNLLLLVFGVFLLLPFAQFTLMPNESSRPTFVACLVSGGMILLGGLGPRVAYLVGGTLLFGLGLALFGPASFATVIFCVIVGLALIPAGVVTLRRELPR